MNTMTHMERLLCALYSSEGWHMLWREHGAVVFKARALINFDRAIQVDTWPGHIATQKGQP
jgi:hypothetical protein